MGFSNYSFLKKCFKKKVEKYEFWRILTKVRKCESGLKINKSDKNDKFGVILQHNWYKMQTKHRMMLKT
jgi:hypothetical protein